MTNLSRQAVRCPPPIPFFPLAPRSPQLLSRLGPALWPHLPGSIKLRTKRLGVLGPMGCLLGMGRGSPNGLCGRRALWVLKVVSSTLDLHCCARGTFPKPKSYDPGVGNPPPAVNAIQKSHKLTAQSLRKTAERQGPTKKGRINYQEGGRGPQQHGYRAGALEKMIAHPGCTVDKCDD